jgi:hypothetical protein
MDDTTITENIIPEFVAVLTVEFNGRVLMSMSNRKTYGNITAMAYFKALIRLSHKFLQHPTRHDKHFLGPSERIFPKMALIFKFRASYI